MWSEHQAPTGLPVPRDVKRTLPGSWGDEHWTENAGRNRAHPAGRDKAWSVLKAAKAEREHYRKLLQNCRELLQRIKKFKTVWLAVHGVFVRLSCQLSGFAMLLAALLPRPGRSAGYVMNRRVRRQAEHYEMFRRRHRLFDSHPRSRRRASQFLPSVFSFGTIS